MWIMIVMSSWVDSGWASKSHAMASPSIASIEFSSRERCINAVKFTKQQPKIYNAFCIQK